MGYLTQYTLRSIPEIEIPIDFQEDFGCDEEGNFDGSRKWYDHEEDVLCLSRAQPNILFTLEGIGEEHDDCWIKYFKNDKMLTSRGNIVYEEVDLTELD